MNRTTFLRSNHQPVLNSPRPWLVIALLLAHLPWTGSAQLVANGLTNERRYNGPVTFTIPTQVGYDYQALLNEEAIPTDVAVTVDEVDYHQLWIYRTNQVSQAVQSRFYHFLIRDPDRDGSESGLPPFTAFPVIPSAAEEVQGGHLDLILPAAFPAGYPIPVVGWMRDAGENVIRANGRLLAGGHPDLLLKRGAGSGFLAEDHPVGALTYAPSLHGLSDNRTIQIEGSEVAWTEVSGAVSGNVVWPSQSRIHVTDSLILDPSATLDIGPGSIVILNGRLDITNNGVISINGTLAEPVVFMPADPQEPWGGFIMRDGTGEVTATATIFTGSGAEPNWFGSGGNPGSHRDEQALFYVENDQRVTLTDCAAIHLAGQFGHADDGGTYILTRFLNQHCPTAGEYSRANFQVTDSAFIDYPDGSAFYENGDNDVLYITSGTHGFTNTLFGWTKDDGVDSGGSGSGILHFGNCWFEANLHEGNALSGTGKDVTHRGGVFIGNGQGLEVGYNGPTGRADRCYFSANLVGARYGDNYDWTYIGFLWVTNSILVYNDRDVWGYNWDDWEYRVQDMDVQANLLSQANSNHPDNALWDPVLNASRLGDYRPNPSSRVGAGLAIHQRQYDLSAPPDSLPVSLSVFRSEPVTIDYEVVGDGTPLDTGQLTFLAGQLLRDLPLSHVALDGYEVVQVRLTDSDHADLTGITDALLVAPDTNAPPATTTLIASESSWRYLVTPVAPVLSWNLVGYNDSAWPLGQAQLGYGDGDEQTTIGFGGDPDDKYPTTYFRSSFAITDPAAFDTLALWLMRDDGAVVYLNGNEVFRSPNMPPGPVTYFTRTTGQNGENTIDRATFSAAGLRAGVNVMGVEVHQADADSSDLSFDLALTGTAPPSSPRLWYLWDGRELLLYWANPGFQLERSSQPDGPWQSVPGARSPWPVDSGTAANAFYRLRR